MQPAGAPGATAAAPVEGSTAAGERPPGDPMRVRLVVDVPIIALGAAVALGMERLGGEHPWAGCGACSTAVINGLDRTVIGNHSEAAATVSDVGLAAAIALPFALDLGDVLIQRARDRSASRSRHLRSWGKDVVVLLETFAVTYAATNVVKFAVKRPRPYSYDPDDVEATENDARLSFFSGHASMSFAMATSYAYLFQTRHPGSRWVAPVWVLGMGVATTTAVMRVEAGKHFWTDIMVGAVAGAAVGLLVPALHRSERFGERLAIGLTPMRTGSLLALRGRF